MWFSFAGEASAFGCRPRLAQLCVFKNKLMVGCIRLEIEDIMIIIHYFHYYKNRLWKKWFRCSILILLFTTWLKNSCKPINNRRRLHRSPRNVSALACSSRSQRSNFPALSHSLPWAGATGMLNRCRLNSAAPLPKKHGCAIRWPCTEPNRDNWDAQSRGTSPPSSRPLPSNSIETVSSSPSPTSGVYSGSLSQQGSFSAHHWPADSCSASARDLYRSANMLWMIPSHGFMVGNTHIVHKHSPQPNIPRSSNIKRCRCSAECKNVLGQGYWGAL